MRREREKTGEPICKKSRLTQRSWALPHGSIHHSPSGVSSALVLVPPGRQRTGVQVGDGGGLWSSVLGDVAPVTWLRRAVTHCDHACTNPHFVFTLLPLFISYLHLISSLRTTLCLLSSPLLDSLYCEMCKKQDLRADLS